VAPSFQNRPEKFLIITWSDTKITDCYVFITTDELDPRLDTNDASAIVMSFGLFPPTSSNNVELNPNPTSTFCLHCTVFLMEVASEMQIS